jgi:hypothetical protein
MKFLIVQFSCSLLLLSPLLLLSLLLLLLLLLLQLLFFPQRIHFTLRLQTKAYIITSSFSSCSTKIVLDEQCSWRAFVYTVMNPWVP